MQKIVVVVPTIREVCIANFKSKWKKHFDFYDADLVVIRDGETQSLEFNGSSLGTLDYLIDAEDRDLVPKFTDSCRDGAFLWTAKNLEFDVLVTFDDDIAPIAGTDPIGAHLNVLGRRVSNTWLNTTHGVDFDYMRGVPFAARAEAEVVVSHGVWIKTPDYDGITQHMRIPQALSEPDKYGNPNFFVGTVPRGVYSPFCGMSIAILRKALPLLYFAPMGKEVGYHRFGDIYCGINLAEELWERNWAMFTGASKVEHTRASNVYSNIASEVKGLEQNEVYYKTPDEQMPPYFADYTEKRLRFKRRMTELLRL